MCCLALCLTIWLLFLLMRFSPLDFRNIPGIGLILPLALAVALLASIVATLLAGAALIRQPRVPLNLMTFGCAIAALFGQMFLFLISRWL
jgi:membrane protein DedA with SNARE-associated domain